MAGSLRLGQSIKSIRGAITQSEFANILNISQGSIAKYENGLAMPRASTLCQIAEIGGVSVEKLMDMRTVKKLSKNSGSITGGTRFSDSKMRRESVDLIVYYAKIAFVEPELCDLLLKITKALALNIDNPQVRDKSKKALKKELEIIHSLSKPVTQ